SNSVSSLPRVTWLLCLSRSSTICSTAPTPWWRHCPHCPRSSLCFWCWRSTSSLTWKVCRDEENTHWPLQPHAAVVGVRSRQPEFGRQRFHNRHIRRFVRRLDPRTGHQAVRREVRRQGP